MDIVRYVNGSRIYGKIDKMEVENPQLIQIIARLQIKLSDKNFKKGRNYL